MREDLVDLDPEAELRDLALDGAGREQILVGDERGAAVDPERVADAGDEEEQADVRVAQDVAERVGQLVPGSVRKQQRALVEHADEARRVAAGAHVAGPVGRRGGEQDEGGEVDEAAGEVVEAIGDLGADDGGGLAEQRAELGLLANRRHQTVFTAPISFTIESFAFPNSIVVRGSRKSSLSIPAKPGAIDRFITTTLVALSTSRIGIP